jgi:hypothetical protein
MHPLNFSNWHPILDFSWIDPSTWHNELPPASTDDGFIGPKPLDEFLDKKSIFNPIQNSNIDMYLYFLLIGYIIYKIK